MRGVKDDIDAELKNKPDLQDLRKKLLRKAQEGLQKVARAADTANSIDHETIWVHLELGDISLAIDGGVDVAKKQYSLAFDLAKQLTDADPRNAQSQRELAISHSKLGAVHLRSGDTKGALEAYRAGMAIFQKLANADPRNAEAQRDLAVSHDRLGDVQLQLGDAKAALETFHKDNEINQKLADADPGNAAGPTRPGHLARDAGHRAVAVGRSQGGIGSVPSRRGHLSEAGRRRSRQCRGSTRPLNIAQALGDVQLQLGDAKEALETYRKYNEISQKVADADPRNAAGPTRPGHLAREAGRGAVAVGRHHGGVGVVPRRRCHQSEAGRRRSSQRPGPTQTWPSRTWAGRRAVAVGRHQGALEAYRAGMAISQKQADADPHDAETQRDLSILHDGLGDVQLRLGDTKGAWKRTGPAWRSVRSWPTPIPAMPRPNATCSSGFSNVGMVAEKEDKFTEAAEWYQKGLDIPKRFAKPEFFATDVRGSKAGLPFAAAPLRCLMTSTPWTRLRKADRTAVLNAVIQAHIHRKRPDRAAAAADRLAAGATNRTVLRCGVRLRSLRSPRGQAGGQGALRSPARWSCCNRPSPRVTRTSPT